MVDLYEIVTSKIKEVTPNVYPKKASRNATFPYVVYKFPTTTYESVREDTMLEVDIWDAKRDGYDVVTAIEDLSERIDKKLRQERKMTNNMFVHFERVNKLDIGDEDENIERIQLRYRLKVYKNNIN